MRLAKEIAAAFYGEEEANRAEKLFVDTFQKGSVPEDIPALKYAQGDSIVDVLLNAGLAKSKSEARRLIEQKGVRFEGTVIEDPSEILTQNGVLQVGKRHFLRITQ